MDDLERAKGFFFAALEQQQQGRLHEAEALYRQAHALAPERESVAINLAQRFPDGTPVWRRAFEGWGVGTVVTSWFWPSGRPLELAMELRAAPDWQQAWSDGRAVLFVRRKPPLGSPGAEPPAASP